MAERTSRETLKSLRAGLDSLEGQLTDLATSLEKLNEKQARNREGLIKIATECRAILIIAPILLGLIVTFGVFREIVQPQKFLDEIDRSEEIRETGAEILVADLQDVIVQAVRNVTFNSSLNRSDPYVVTALRRLEFLKSLVQLQDHEKFRSLSGIANGLSLIVQGDYQSAGARLKSLDAESDVTLKKLIHALRGVALSLQSLGKYNPAAAKEFEVANNYTVHGLDLGMIVNGIAVQKLWHAQSFNDSGAAINALSEARDSFIEAAKIDNTLISVSKGKNNVAYVDLNLIAMMLDYPDSAEIEMQVLEICDDRLSGGNSGLGELFDDLEEDIYELIEWNVARARGPFLETASCYWSLRGELAQKDAGNQVNAMEFFERSGMELVKALQADWLPTTSMSSAKAKEQLCNKRMRKAMLGSKRLGREEMTWRGYFEDYANKNFPENPSADRDAD